MLKACYLWVTKQNVVFLRENQVTSWGTKVKRHVQNANTENIHQYSQIILMKMASKYNKSIEDCFTRQIQQNVDPPGQSDNTCAQNEARDPPNLLRAFTTAEHRHKLSPQIVQLNSDVVFLQIIIVKKNGATHLSPSLYSESLIIYGLQITISSEIPFLKTLSVWWIYNNVYYHLEAKEVAISDRVCFALVKGFQIGHTDTVDKRDHFLQAVTGKA